MSRALPHLLIVEDDQVDLLAIQRQLGALGLVNPVTVARDGVEALEYLRGERGRPRVPRPCVILLDLQLPRMNGIDLLSELGHDEELRQAPVFALTTSPHDLERLAYHGCAVSGAIDKREIAQVLPGLLRPDGVNGAANDHAD